MVGRKKKQSARTQKRVLKKLAMQAGSSSGVSRSGGMKALNTVHLGVQNLKKHKKLFVTGKGAIKKAKDVFLTVRAAKKSFKKGVTNMPKVAANYGRTGAMQYPGSRYIGPGNALDMGPPKHKGDWIAYQHDHMYDELQKKGVDPYWTFNKADEWALKAADPKDPKQAPVYWGMIAKKTLPKDKTPVKKVPDYHVKYAKSKLNKPKGKEAKY